MEKPHIIIAGGGIGGMAMALTLNQIGASFHVIESVSELRPLGVGINLQPNAVRELYDLGITEDMLAKVGVKAKEWALVGLNGKEIYAEPRGELAGYNWPQFAVHRGKFHMILYHTLLERAGVDTVTLGHKVTGYNKLKSGKIEVTLEDKDGNTATQLCDILIGADGIHSNIRAQMHPEQPPINWGGALMWRGTTRAVPVRTGSTFLGLGTHRHRMVIYPISDTDPETGLCDVNWIAEVTYDDPNARENIGWFRKAELDDVIPHFADWTYDWLNVPDLLSGAQEIYENPMIDRDPIETWRDGAVVLMGDAAHAMYPTGSNGASQAIIDAREIGAAMVAHGVTEAALASYDEKLCGPVSALVLRNRGAGPFGILNVVDERCGGVFDDIETVMPQEEREAFMANYKAAAGFAIETLNAAPPILAKDAKLS